MSALLVPPRPYATLAVLLLGCVAVVAPDTLSGTERGRRMLHRLWDTARARADELRAAEGDANERPWSAGDLMAKAIDYTREQMEHPPLDSVEYNLLVLRDAVHALAREVAVLRGRVCTNASDIQLVPVQTKRYTRIKPAGDEGG